MSDVPHSEPVYTTQQVATEDDVCPRISWRAVLAGVAVLLSLSWMMHLLGAATGLSVADATDSANMEGGLSVGSSIWMIVSWLIAFFIGSLVAARLAGHITDYSGMLHGLTVWGLATVLMVALAFSGMTYLLETGYSVVTSAMSGVGATVAEAGGAADSRQGGPAAMVRQTLDTQFASTIQDRLIDSAAEAGSTMSAPLTPQAIRQEISGLDDRTLRRLVTDLNADDLEGAAETLESQTRLPNEAATSIVQGAQQSLQGGAADAEGLTAETLRPELVQQAANYAESAGSSGEESVTSEELRRAFSQLDDQAMQSVTLAVMQGDERRAKQALARNTELNDEQVNQVYEGAKQSIEDELETYQESVEEAVATVTDYTQAFLWTAFGGTAMALLVSLGGGWVGADATRRVVTTHRRSVRPAA